jgi:hypothetical protein
MAQDVRGAKRVVIAPRSAGAMSAGEVLSVEVGPDEDVEWVWSHDPRRGRSVTGYKIVPRVALRQSVA